MLEGLDPGAPFTLGSGRGIVDEFVSTDTPDSLDTALLMAETHGLLVGPSTGAAVKAALEIGKRKSMTGKRILVIAPSSGVRYLQHPMFRSLRKQAFYALSEEEAAVSKNDHGSAGTSGTPRTAYATVKSMINERALEEKRIAIKKEMKLNLVNRVQGCILKLVQNLLNAPTLNINDNLIDHGATSLTAMLLLGKLRSSLEGVLEGEEIRGLKLAIIKERLWGCTRDLALGVVGVDEMGNEHPYHSIISPSIVIEYCGG